MPEYLAPGIYVEETATATKPVEGVATSTCAFIDRPVRVIIDKHVIAGMSRVSAFGWAATVTRYRVGEDDTQIRSSPGHITFEPLTLARDLTYDPTFDGWINQAASGARQNLRKTIVVELLDQDGHVDTRWRFRNAWPSKFKVAPVNVGGNTAAAELVTIEHEGFERESVVDVHFKFHVAIEGVQVGAFSEASGLSAEGDEITERRSNERKLGGLRKYSNIALKRGYTQDRSLWNWYRNTIAGQSDDRRRVTITLMNEALQPVQRWHAEHAWVIKYDPTSLDADSNNIAVDTIEIAHEGLTIEPDDKV